MLLRKISSAVVVAALAVGILAGSAFATVPKVQESRFSALRHAPSSLVPAEVKRFLGRSGSEALGIDVSETRRLAAPDGGSWDVIPGAAGICLFVESEQTGACASTADALAGRLTMQFVAPGSARPVPGQPFSVPTNTPRFKVGLLPDEAVSMTAALTSRDSLLARPNNDGLYRLASSTGVIGTVTMHRVGKRPLKITTAHEPFNGPVKAHKAACTPGVNCYCQSIPNGYGNSCFYGTSYNYPFYSGQWGGWAGLRSLRISSADGNIICAAPLNPDQTWGGNFFCNNQGYTLVHLYDGSLRIGFAGAGAPSSFVLGKAYYEFT